MNYLVVLGHLIFGGMILGASIDNRYERCSEKVEFKVEDVYVAAFWPVLVGVSLTTDTDRLTETKCEGNSK